MKFIESIKNVWKITELKDRIILTLGMLLVYRFGAQVVLPGIDASKLGGIAAATDSGLLGLLNAFTGGAFANASVFALGIMPYISASIVVQLMGIAIPYLQKLQKEGASGQKKITQITRWLTIAICMVQAPGYLVSLPALGIPQEAFLLGQGGVFYFSSIIILVTGTIFAMWLGEKITDKGIGNGISILIMVGIVARLPLSFVQEYVSRVTESNGGLIMILIELVIWLVIILASIMLVLAVRKIKVQYARRTASGGYEKNIFGSRQYIPLKLNASGVMPIIFAQAIMFVPSLIGGSGFLKDTATGKKNDEIDLKFKVGDRVKIRLFNDKSISDPFQHPIHFHGQRFLVLEKNGIKSENLAWKDTVLVPIGSYVDILLDVTNPGEWMAHCHIAEHLTSGMKFNFIVTES
ncbi:MAG: multicopper oxidase domain-containing protein [Bacteroidetes bacterium]|nr:multicopper oxidase domain-containing protein [Bacteroidota bacterium]